MKIGDKIKLIGQEQEIVACKECKKQMVNIDANELKPGDLTTLKRVGVKISNPETDEPVCISCEHKTLGRKIADWFNSDEEEDDDFFSSGGGFLGGSSSGGGFGGFSGGGFGGFGGGGFSGGGAARGF